MLGHHPQERAMIMKALKDYLDREQVYYAVIRHPHASSAQEVAAAAHIPGKEMAKTVVMKVDGEPALVVLPASSRVDVLRLLETTGTFVVELAREEELSALFPGCELGAMPPFGNLFGLPTYVAEELTDDEEIAFNAGSSTEVILMMYQDYERLVQPRVLPVGVPA
jgi:Ala-tRNA(Pro) deacylase